MEEIYGIVGFLGAVFSLIALIVYFQDARKIEPRIIQTYHRVLNDGNFQIQALISNVGKRTAKNCSAKFYVDNNPVGDLEFHPVDSPLGRLGKDWPILTSFDVHPNIPIWVKGYLSPDYENSRVQIELFLRGDKVDQSNSFTLTVPAISSTMEAIEVENKEDLAKAYADGWSEPFQYETGKWILRRPK